MTMLTHFQHPRVTKSPAQRVLDVFLPAGYPHSVTEDYIQYQIYVRVDIRLPTAYLS